MTGFLLLEGALSAAALIVRVTGRASPVRFTTENLRVLSTGDSNTYGLWVSDQKAYPAAFQRLWNARHPDRPVEVVNVGFPANNSSGLRNVLPRFLEIAKPSVVTIMIGGNDFWTESHAVVQDADASGPDAGASWLWRHCRVYRLLFMLRRSPEATLEDTRPADGFFHFRTSEGPVQIGEVEAKRTTPIGIPQLADDARTNLLAIAEIARRHHAEPVFLTYPADINVYGMANRWMRDAAAASGARLIDLGAAFGPRCSENTCTDLLFPDGHPTARGHEFAAETMAEHWDEPSPVTQ